MAHYVVLFNFTARGFENIKASPNRVQDAKHTFKMLGAEVISFFALLGRYDTLFVVNAPNDETVAKACMAIGSLGNVHTETLRAFTETEYNRIVSEIP